MHAHDLKSGRELTDRRVLIVGSSFSAEDITAIAWKNKCKSVCCTYRTKPMPFEWPENVTTRPLV